MTYKLNIKRGLRIVENAEEAEGEIGQFMGADGKREHVGAIVGIGTRCGQPTLLIYSAKLVIESMMANSGMSYEDASEYFDFNTAGAWFGPHTPIILEDRSDEEDEES